jgi:hypothetical protein
LYEEAITVYKKYDNHALALVEDIVSIDKAVDFATKVNKRKFGVDSPRLSLTAFISRMHW